MALIVTVGSSVFADDLQTLERAYEDAKLSLSQSKQSTMDLCNRVEEVRLLTEAEDTELKAVCMAEIKEIVREKKASGMSRKEIMPLVSPLIFACQDKARGATTADLINAQEQCLAAHDDLKLTLDTVLTAQKAYISEQERVLSAIKSDTATLRANTATLRAKRATIQANTATLEADSARMLREAEEILQNLARQ